EFLEKNWDSLKEKLANDSTLERLVRRRAAMQLGRLASGAGGLSEVETIEGLEYYVCPHIAEEFRLGEILKVRDSDEYCVISTPHCHLTIQTGAESPRADLVLVVKTVTAEEVWKAHPLQGGTEEKRLKGMAGLTQSPARHDKIKPKGRYWFLPGFLDMPDLYCDFSKVESVPFGNLEEGYERFAVLDAPFAEALQSCFTAFYSAVGLPSLNVEQYRELARKSDNGD
ncbi:MAG: hypothetical protein ACC652_09040, partial [Acidimicrobiales bacterium]